MWSLFSILCLPYLTCTVARLSDTGASYADISHSAVYLLVRLREDLFKSKVWKRGGWSLGLRKDKVVVDNTILEEADRVFI